MFSLFLIFVSAPPTIYSSTRLQQGQQAYNCMAEQILEQLDGDQCAGTRVVSFRHMEFTLAHSECRSRCLVLGHNLLVANGLGSLVQMRGNQPCSIVSTDKVIVPTGSGKALRRG